MALWGKTDTLASAPKWLQSEVGARPHTGMVENAAAVWPNDIDEAYFIDATEATITSNRAKGLKTAGWNAYDTYTDGNGATRHRVETLVAMRVSAVDAGDAGVTGNTVDEDAVAADA